MFPALDLSFGLTPWVDDLSNLSDFSDFVHFPDSNLEMETPLLSEEMADLAMFWKVLRLFSAIHASFRYLVRVGSASFISLKAFWSSSSLRAI